MILILIRTLEKIKLRQDAMEEKTALEKNHYMIL